MPLELDNLLLIQYFPGLTRKKKPRAYFMGTAHGAMPKRDGCAFTQVSRSRRAIQWQYTKKVI